MDEPIEKTQSESNKTASTEKPPTRARRGRAAKLAQIEDAAEAETSAIKTPRRKRRVATTESTPTAIETVEEEAVKPKRGRTAKATAPKEVFEKAVVEVEPAVTEASKGRKRGHAEIKTMAEAESTKEAAIDVEETSVSSKPKRGRAAKAVVEEDPVVLEMKPKRGRAAKATKEVEKKPEEELSTPATSQDKPGRGRSKPVTSATKDESCQTVDYTSTDSAEAEESAEGGKRPKRGQAKPQSKPVKVAASGEESVATPPRRTGRAASAAANQKISSDVAELSNLSKKKRRPATPKYISIKYIII